MHHLVLDVVDLGLATEFVIARCVLAISPDTLYVPQFSGWCDLDPLNNYKSSASSSEGNAVCHMEFSEAPSDAAAVHAGTVVEVRGLVAAPSDAPGPAGVVVELRGARAAQAGAGLNRDVATIDDDCEARSDTTTYIGDELPRLSDFDTGKFVGNHHKFMPAPPSAPPPPLPPPYAANSSPWVRHGDLLQTGVLKFSVDDTIWRMEMWHTVKISDSLLAGEHPPIGKDQTITYLALGYSPEDKVYDRNQLYDPSPMLQKMVGKALAINKALKVLQVEMVTAPSMRVRLGIELAEAWTNAISEKRVVYGPMVSFYAAKRWTFKKRPETERPRSL